MRRPDEATKSLLEGLGHVDDPFEEARARDALGTAARGDPEQARTQWRRALAIYDELGSAEASDLRERLAALEGGS